MKKYSMILSKIVRWFSLCAALLMMSSFASAGNPTSVPEPGPLGLLVLGGVALAIARRIHRNK